jgi:hypothetical protein
VSVRFRRRQADALARRLAEPRRFIQIVAGPRQAGKTTLVRQVLDEMTGGTRYASADDPAPRDRAWLEAQWEAARLAAREDPHGAVLVIDEAQKVAAWPEIVKRLWDEDTATATPLRVVLLGSAPLLIQKGLTESLAGRFELIRLSHWSLAEMREAFGWDLERFILFGGYPGAATLISEPDRWRRYILDSLIEATISRDVLLLTRVDKPALLRRLFNLACLYSGQILSYQKMLGQLLDAGNTTTLAHYLELLSAAGMVLGVQKYAGQVVRQRASSPKLVALNTALVTAQLETTPDEIARDPQHWGRLTETAVGAHLAIAAQHGDIRLFYWREGNVEVDYVVEAAGRVTAIEVKSSRRRDGMAGMGAFERAFGPCRKLLVGADGIDVGEFLTRPAEHWVGS